MLHDLLVVVLIGLADSLNPTTLGPAMYLATTDRPVRGISHFVAGLVAVNIVGGVAIAIGVGKFLLDLVPKPEPTTEHIIEVVAGAALLVIAVLLWAGRRGLGRRTPPAFKPSGRSGVALGAGIALVELPTALPYFAAIAVIVGSGASAPEQLSMVVAYNIAFVAPVLAMLLALVVLGDRARPLLARVNQWVLGHWPGILAMIAGGLGTVILAIGAYWLINR
jgi:cytochrome c biogenesis protein CcdA